MNLLVLVLNNTMGAELAVGICIAVMTAVIVICDRNESKRKKTIFMAAIFLLGTAATLIVSSSLRESVFTLASDTVNILTGKTTGHEGSDRLLKWETVIGYIQEKPLFGFGCEGITMRMGGDAHCELLTYAAYYGIPAVIFYLGAIIAATYTYFRNRMNIPSYCRVAFLAASVYFLSSLVGVVMFYTVPFFFIFMGMSNEEYKTV